MKEKNQKQSVKTIPDGFHSVTPFLIVEGASKLMDFIVKAFGGEIASSMKTDDGKIMHATVKIGNSLIMITDAMEKMPAMQSMLYLYVEDVDSVYQKALRAKEVSSLREPTDEFYGDRSAGLQDQWGNQWWIATHLEDVTEEELKRRQEELTAKEAVSS